MAHADVAHSGASPAACVLQADPELRHRPPGHMSDIALADAAARAARMVPGVVDLSPGHAAPAATYGPGRRVEGVVVHHHPTPAMLVLDVHMVLSEAHCKRASAEAAQSGERVSAGHGPVRVIADRVRGAVRDATQDIAAPVHVWVDVFIDDLR